MSFHKFVVIIVSVLLTVSFVYAQMTTPQIVKKYSISVVTIVALDRSGQQLSLGSGFFINTEGDIATNHHVLEGSAKAIIKTMDGRKGEILEITNDDPELDLLIAKTSLKNTNPAPLGDSDTITLGEEILVIGNPAGLEGTVSNGIISGVREVDRSKFIQITAPISPGSSGGPVFNLTGKVIGVTTATLHFGQNLNFAMPINYLKSIKPISIKLSSLPKTVPTAGTDILVEIQNRYEKTNDIEANFIQEYFGKGMKQPNRGEGKVYFKKKGMMRWDYTVPNQKLISDGHNLWYYQPDEKQVLISDVSSVLKEKTPLAFLAGEGNLSRDFKLLNLSESVFQKEDNYVVELAPREPIATLSKLILTVDKKAYIVLQADVLDALGNVTRTRFIDIKTNGGLSSSLFQFTSPPGTEVIKMQGPSAPAGRKGISK